MRHKRHSQGGARTHAQETPSLESKRVRKQKEPCAESWPNPLRTIGIDVTSSWDRREPASCPGPVRDEAPRRRGCLSIFSRRAKMRRSMPTYRPLLRATGTCSTTGTGPPPTPLRPYFFFGQPAPGRSDQCPMHGATPGAVNWAWPRLPSILDPSIDHKRYHSINT